MTDQLQLVPPSTPDEQEEYEHAHRQRGTQDQHQISRLSHQIAHQRLSMKPSHRKIAEMFFQGHTKQQIATATQVSPQTVDKTLHTTKALKLASLFAEIEELRNGPSLRQRRNMLWRIALQNEQKSPATAQRSIDLLNKQQGVYTPEDTSTSNALTVNIQNFQVNVQKPPEHAQTIKDIPKTLVDFVPVTVETP